MIYYKLKVLGLFFLVAGCLLLLPTAYCLLPLPLLLPLY